MLAISVVLLFSATSFAQSNIALNRDAGCTLSEWSDFSSCSVSSGRGGQVRSRYCLASSPNDPLDYEIRSCQVEEVIVVVGGYSEEKSNPNLNDVEVYSPNSGCVKQLAPFPKLAYESITFFYGGKISVCGGNTEPGPASFQECYQYDPSNDSWNVFTTMPKTHWRKYGAVYGNKLYVLGNDVDSEVFDFKTKTWTPMSSSKIPINTWSPCMVTWKDSLIVFGGSSVTTVQAFNITTKSWKVLSAMPEGRIAFGCTQLPNNPDKFLVAGLHDGPRNSAAIYDASTDTWTKAASTKYGRQGTSLVSVMGRIFAMGGLGDSNTAVVEEYIPGNNSWVELPNPFFKKRHFRALGVPASVFENLSGGCKGF